MSGTWKWCVRRRNAWGPGYPHTCTAPARWDQPSPVVHFRLGTASFLNLFDTKYWKNQRKIWKGDEVQTSHIGETLKFRLKLTKFVDIFDISIKYQKNFYISSKPVLYIFWSFILNFYYFPLKQPISIHLSVFSQIYIAVFRRMPIY